MSELWPEGQYVGSAVAAASSQSGNGNAQVIVTVDFGDGKSRKVWFTFAPGKGEEIATKQLKELGWNGEFGDKCEFSAGLNREWYMKHDTYGSDKPNYKGPREKWNLSNPELLAKPLDAGGQARLSAKFRAQAGVTLKPTTGKPATPPAAKTKGPPAAKAYGKAEAWADWEKGAAQQKAAGKGAGEVDVQAWTESIGTISDGDEMKFKEADWKKLGEIGLLPF